jgi:hypothetical protein
MEGNKLRRCAIYTRKSSEEGFEQVDPRFRRGASAQPTRF